MNYRLSYQISVKHPIVTHLSMLRCVTSIYIVYLGTYLIIIVVFRLIRLTLLVFITDLDPHFIIILRLKIYIVKGNNNK